MRAGPWIVATIIFATLYVVTFFEANDWCDVFNTCG